MQLALRAELEEGALVMDTKGLQGMEKEAGQVEA